MAYASRLYPRAKPRGFTLQWINLAYKANGFVGDFLGFLS